MTVDHTGPGGHPCEWCGTYDVAPEVHYCGICQQAMDQVELHKDDPDLGPIAAEALNARGPA